MSKLSRRAGQNIRELALKRRIKAITHFASAGFVICLPFFLANTFKTFLKQLSVLNPAQAASFNLLPILYLLFLVVAGGFITSGVFLWRRANHADQGAKGEEETAQELFQLEQEGWKIEYGMRLGRRLGDADIVCISPQKKAYVIDVKSHRGKVTTDGKQLYRCMGKTTYSFEKNFLNQAMQQAIQVKQQKKLDFVTPIVAFSNAQVSVPSGKLQKVYVVEKSKLLPLLKSLN